MVSDEIRIRLCLGIGVTLQRRNGTEVATISKRLGHGTSNQAEYHAAIAGLQEARRLGAQEVELRTDSELLVRQVTGAYAVRDAELEPLWVKLCGLLQEFHSGTVTHVRREHNGRADTLAKQALVGSQIWGSDLRPLLQEEAAKDAEAAELISDVRAKAIREPTQQRRTRKQTGHTALQRAIRRKCLDCSCGRWKEVELCSVPGCALWPHRLGHA